MNRRAMGACGLMLLACGSEPIAGPSLDDLRGEWTMSWTEAGPGISCTWSNVTLTFRDPKKGQAGSWGGGEGSCSGLIDSDRLVFLSFVLDSLTVNSGYIRFVPRATTYQFAGRVDGDEMSGGMSSNLRYVETETQVQTRGRWRAVRVPTP